MVHSFQRLDVFDCKRIWIGVNHLISHVAMFLSFGVSNQCNATSVLKKFKTFLVDGELQTSRAQV